MFFAFFAINNQDILRFSYLSAALAGVFQFFQLFLYAEIYYLLYDFLSSQNVAVRVCGIIWIVLNAATTVFCIVWVIVKSQNIVYVVSTVIMIIILLIVMILCSLPKSHGNAFVVMGISSQAGIHYLRICAGNQSGFEGISTILDQVGIDVCNSFLVIFSVVALFMMNIVQITPKTLFNGSSAPPEINAFLSTTEDEDSRSEESSYYYWAFHLLMMQASCYMQQICAFSGPRELNIVNFSFGVAGSWLFLLYLGWTAFVPLVLKDRMF